MDLVIKISLLISAFLMALIAGLFYSYSCSVNPGLSQLSNTEYLKAMKSINKAILNPLFFLSFLGSLVMTPLTTGLYFYRSMETDLSFYLLASASLVYVTGVFGTTVLGNVPLNNSLEAFDIGKATSDEIKLKRLSFEGAWNRLHAARTIANAIALILLLSGLIYKVN
jgi:uncharacterized membrane protein